MKRSFTFIFFLLLVLIQAISSFEVIDDEQDEIKLDDVRRPIPTLPYYPSSSSGLVSNGPECLPKNLLLNMLSRNRRASISRPYFYHWRPARDNSRYASKNFLAFSPRLGKRAYEDENVQRNKRQAEEEISSPDLETFLLTLASYLQRKKIDIVYEDATKICLSEAVDDALIKEIWEKFDGNRRQQEEQEARERQSKNKHPLLFRYRLG